jgi:ankyrin repeat protein
MEEAVRGGHMEIVKLMIEKGANNFDRVMSIAAREGQLDIVKLMISKATAYGFKWAMRIAAREGHMEIVKLMIENGADDFDNSMVRFTKI